jgi:hypothetical protein
MLVCKNKQLIILLLKLISNINKKAIKIIGQELELEWILCQMMEKYKP